MSIELTDSGLKIDTFQEVYEELEAALKAIYGEDIDLDPESPDGQRIGIEAKTNIDLQSAIVDLYNSLDPDFAGGQRLNSSIKFAGIKRRPASLSQVDATITTTKAMTLPAGYEVLDTIEQTWASIDEQTLIEGDNIVTLFSSDYGAITALPDTVNNPVVIVKGVDTVNNLLSAKVGVNEETDQELRIRRNLSTENPSSTTIGGIYSVLGDIAGVTDLSIYENDQDFLDTELDLAGHSIWVIIDGGDVSEIAEAMAKTKNGGTGMKGDILAIYTETPDLDQSIATTIDHTMRFDRPVYTEIYLDVSVKSKTGNDINTDVIKEAIAAQSFRIGEEMIATEIYAAIYNSHEEISAKDIMIYRQGEQPTEELQAEPIEKFTISIENINITEL